MMLLQGVDSTVRAATPRFMHLVYEIVIDSGSELQNRASFPGAKINSPELIFEQSRIKI